MQLKTILNRVTNYKSFVVEKVKWVPRDSEELALEVRCDRARTGVRSAPVVEKSGRATTGPRSLAVSSLFPFG